MKLLELIILFGILLLNSCQKTPQPSAETSGVPKSGRPLALMVERTISGEILNKKIERPFGVCTDRRGYIYLIDRGDNRLLLFDADFKPVRDAGGRGSGDGLLDQPSFVSLDQRGNVLVADQDNRRVNRYASTLIFQEEISFADPDDPFKFGKPSGVAVTDFGSVWIADRENGRIVIFDHLGQFDHFLEESEFSGKQFRSPEKILFDGENLFYVCDAGNSRILVFDVHGSIQREIDVGILGYPIAAAIDRQLLWVLDGANGRITAFTLSGDKLFETGPLIPGSPQALSDPSDIALLGSDYLLISDSGNDRLLVCRIIYENQ